MDIDEKIMVIIAEYIKLVPRVLIYIFFLFYDIHNYFEVIGGHRPKIMVIIADYILN